MTELADLLTRAAGTVSAAAVIIGMALSVHRWYLTAKEKDEAHDRKIAQIKEENRLIVYALSACLDGLMQLGANHDVPEAKKKLDEHLNEQAHK